MKKKEKYIVSKITVLLYLKKESQSWQLKMCHIKYQSYVRNHVLLFCFFITIYYNNISSYEKRIGKISKKSKLNSEKIWKVWNKNKLNSEKISKIWKKGMLDSEKI